MKNAIITGATGMVGGIVLRECLASPEIGKVTIIVRRTTGIKNAKLTEVVHKDFLNYEGLEDHFKNQDIAYFCLGVYTGAVSNDKFREITVDYTKVFADALMANQSNPVFCFLSGQGADRKEKSRVAFAKFKGIAENYLIAKAFKALYVFRPGYIYPVEKRAEPNLSYRIFRRLYPLMKSIFPKAVITSEMLGKAIFAAGFTSEATKGQAFRILENEDIKIIKNEIDKLNA